MSATQECKVEGFIKLWINIKIVDVPNVTGISYRKIPVRQASVQNAKENAEMKPKQGNAIKSAINKEA